MDKNIYFFLLVFLLINGSSQAQCPSQNITLYTQKEVDEFSLNYPNCTDLTGSLTIESSGNNIISNFNGLSHLKSIGGNLSIAYSVKMLEAKGFDNLTSIKGKLTLNLAAERFNFLNNLRDVGEVFILSDKLKWIAGFDKLDSVKTTFRINASYYIENIDGLNSLKYIGSDLLLSTQGIKNITGFNQLNTIKGNMELSSLDLTEISGFNSLVSVGELNINSLYRLKSITGFQNLKPGLNTNINFFKCDSLMNLGPVLNKSTAIGSLYIANCKKLSSLSSSDLRYIKGPLEIASCPNLTDIIALQKLDSVGGKFTLSNTLLTDLQELSNLKSTASFTISNMPELSNIIGLLNLTAVKGRLSISGNPKLTSLSGLENVNPEFLKGDIFTAKLSITNNAKLSICNTVCQLIALEEIYKIIDNNAVGCENSRVAWVNCDLHKCFKNGVAFLDQESIDVFKLDHKHCEVIDGPVCIGACNASYTPETITNLNGLSQLDSIWGNFTMKNIANIALAPISQLRTVRGDFEADSIGSIDFTNFNASLSGSFKVSNSKVFGFPSYFRRAKTIFGDFIYENNTGITSFPNFEELLSINGNLLLNKNADIGSFPGFERNIKIFGDLVIKDNKKLGGVNYNYSHIDHISGDLIFKNNLVASIFDIRLDSIFGDFEVTDNPNLGNFYSARTLKYINGKFQLSNNPKINNLYFDPLRYVNGDFIIENCDNIYSLKSFRYLDAINGSLVIRNNDALSSLEGLHKINLNSIQSQNGQQSDIIFVNNVKLSDCDFWNLCDALKSSSHEIEINGNLKKCTNNDSLTLDCKIIECPLGLNLTNQKEIDEFDRNYYDCEYIEKWLDIRSNVSDAIYDLSGLRSIKYVGEDIDITDCKIRNLNGLQNIKYVGKGIYLLWNDFINSFEGMPNLDTLNSLHISSGNDSLQNFNGLYASKRINELTLFSTDIQSFKGMEGVNEIGKLSVSFSDQLTDLSGLENIERITDLSLSSNENLVSIKEIDNVNVYDSSSLNLSFNKKLEWCNTRYVCKILSNQTCESRINLNALGCQNIDDVDCKNYQAFVEIFYDANQNKVKDVNEFGIPNESIMVDGNLTRSISDMYGKIRIFCDSGNVYTIRLVDYDNWILTTENEEFTFQFDPINNLNSIYRFGLYPKTSSHNFECHVSSERTRCSQIVRFDVSYLNFGTFSEDGKLTIKYDEATRFESSIPSPINHDPVNHIVEYSFNQMQPYQRNKIEMYFEMPDFQFAGNKIEMMSYVDRLNELGNFEQVATHNYHSMIRCSYDPNDKQVSPLGINENNLTLIGEELNYHIRFQNTGNDYAEIVRIVDTLNENLDVSTFKLIDASHEVNVSINGNIITFLFDKINLPDSTTNEQKSHGYIFYTIKEKPNLMDNAKIENTAHIYFDFNPAVITNTTLNTMVYNLPTNTQNTEIRPKLRIYPNPASDELLIEMDRYAIESVNLYNSLGNMLISKHDNKIINVSNLPEGMYFIKVNYFDGLMIRSVLDRVAVNH